MNENSPMTYCVKCGTKNLDDAKTCFKCGANLWTINTPDSSNECFGLPDGNAIASIVFGFFIIVAGISFLFGLDFWRIFWPLLLIIVGSLIVIGSIYSFRRR